jgi:hypothetical protein
MFLSVHARKIRVTCLSSILPYGFIAIEAQSPTNCLRS